MAERSILPGSVDNDTLVLAASFNQSWLCFGTLEEVLEINVVGFSLSDSIQRGDDGLWSITTALLPRCICYWIVSEGETSVAVKEVRLGRIDKCIQEVYNVIQSFRKMKDGPDLEEVYSTALEPVVRDDRRSHIMLSLILLAETLVAAKTAIYKDFADGSRDWEEMESVRAW